MNTRREVLKAGLAGFGLVVGGTYLRWTQAATTPVPLLDAVSAVCHRLGAAGWREMLLDVTGGEFDMLAGDMKAELAKPLSKLNRECPGFGDFAASGNRAIEPGQPDYSLLYHALAAPSVIYRRNGQVLGAFPTLAEIETVENYIYASRKQSLARLRSSFANESLGIVTFALQYRNAPMSVSGAHAQLCFSRTGVARIGELGPHYDARLRAFTGFDNEHPHEFHVVPRRYAAYLAVQRKAGSGGFGPQDLQPGDDQRLFWVPVHKLFSGKQCLTDVHLTLEFDRTMLNDELASFHRFLQYQGLANNWSGPHLEEFPFSIRNERIASLATQPDYGTGVLEPRANTLVEEAWYHDQRLTFPVDPKYSGNEGNLQLSSLFVLPGAQPPKTPGYQEDAEQETGRPAPEYINIRHRVIDGRIDDLNDRPNLMEILRVGGYNAQHYIDYSGDGWIVARSPELAAAGVTHNVPAFCMVGLPDFLPQFGQRELMLWWENEVPEALRAAL